MAGCFPWHHFCSIGGGHAHSSTTRVCGKDDDKEGHNVSRFFAQPGAVAF
jgi:hypothetical protein